MRNPALEEIGARAKLFELGTLGVNSSKFIEWLINNCNNGKDKAEAIITKKAIGLLAERLIMPLQITYYLTRILEKGYQIGEKPVNLETAKSILLPELDSLESTLARHGYNLSVLCDHLNARRQEVKAYFYFGGQLAPSRLEELNKEIHKLGVVL